MGMRYESKDQLSWAIFYEAAYRVGFTLMELGRMITAEYYLLIALHANDPRNIHEYINFLVNNKEPEALDYVRDAIAKAPKPNTDNEEEIAGWNFHVAFLKRRLSYILIDRGHFDEAETLLKQMLDDPLSKDFAKGELDYMYEQFRRL